RVCHIITQCCENINDNHPVAVLMRDGFEDSLAVVRALCGEAENLHLLQPHVTPENASDMIMAFMCGVYTCSLRHPDLYAAKRDWAPIVDALLGGLFVKTEV